MKNLLIKTEKWIQLGFLVSYDIINKANNDTLENGQSLFDFTFYIKSPTGEILFTDNFDSMEEGFSGCLNFLEKDKRTLVELHHPRLINDYNYLSKHGEVDIHNYQDEAQLRAMIQVLDEFAFDVDYEFDHCVFTK